MATTSQGTSASTQSSRSGISASETAAGQNATAQTAAGDTATVTLSATEHRLEEFAEDEANDRRTFRRSIVVAGLFHLGLFAITFPSFTSDPPTEPEAKKLFVVETVTFEPPPPEPQPIIPKAKTRIVPVPDQTPHDPEPVRILAPEQFDDLPIDAIDIDIPLAPPEPDTGPRFVTADVEKPEKLVYPAPRYTEIARKTRIHGTVIIQSTIDAQGNVVDAKILKGLPMGLSEAAIDAVLQWKFRPATLNGKPIPVYFNLTVTFSVS